MDMVVNNKCTPVFAGMRSCTSMEYVDASLHERAPYFPFTGDSKWVRLLLLITRDLLISANWMASQNRFAMELHPTGEVTEYTATIVYELLREGDDGQHKVDSVKFLLRAEGNLQTSKALLIHGSIWNGFEVFWGFFCLPTGVDPTEARAVMKYNRQKNLVTADIEIPDYDVEAGVRMGITEGNTKGKGPHSITLDFVNKNIPQLSLVARAK